MRLMYSEAVNGTEDIQSEPAAIITTYEDDNGELQGLDPILFIDPNIDGSEKIAKQLVILFNLHIAFHEDYDLTTGLLKDGN